MGVSEDRKYENRFYFVGVRCLRIEWWIDYIVRIFSELGVIDRNSRVYSGIIRGFFKYFVDKCIKGGYGFIKINMYCRGLCVRYSYVIMCVDLFYFYSFYVIWVMKYCDVLSIF